jgi:hypothetical protein
MVFSVNISAAKANIMPLGTPKAVEEHRSNDAEALSVTHMLVQVIVDLNRPLVELCVHVVYIGSQRSVLRPTFWPLKIAEQERG